MPLVFTFGVCCSTTYNPSLPGPSVHFTARTELSFLPFTSSYSLLLSLLLSLNFDPVSRKIANYGLIRSNRTFTDILVDF